MIITLDIPANEMALLQKQADECNLQMNRKVPLTAEDIAMQELQPIADSLIKSLADKFSTADRNAVIAATLDPMKLAAMKAVIG